MKFVGIDFGHGEVSASCYDGEQLKRLRLVLITTENPDMYKIPSYLYKCVGEGNTISYSLEEHSPCSLISGMKKPVGNMSDEEKGQYQIFIQLVYQRLLECNQELLADGDFKLAIACPTRWNKTQKAEYKAFFEEALGKSIYAIMNESDAAYFAKRTNEKANSSTLVVDYGSSTIDFTLVRNGSKVEDDADGVRFDDWSSADLGASNIEDRILSLYQNDRGISPTYNEIATPVEQILVDAERNWIDYNAFIKKNIREFKEQTFTLRKEYFTSPIFYRPITHGGCEELLPLEFKYVVKERILEIPGIKKYIEAVKGHFKRVHGATGDVDKIILSGGAACMVWVSEALKDEFGQKTTIVLDSQPAYVVCDGIVKYCSERQKCLDAYLKEIEEIDVPDIIKRTDEDVINTLRFSLLSDVFTHYASANIGKTTIDDLLDDIVDKTFRVFNSSNEEYAHMVNKHIRERIIEIIENHLQKVIRDVFGMNTKNLKSTTAQFPKEELIRPSYKEKTLNDVREYIKYVIIDNLSLPFILFSITYDKPRIKSHREIIVAELRKKESMDKFDGIERLMTFDDLDNDFVEKVKDYIRTFAMELFDEKELFKTRFTASKA